MIEPKNKRSSLRVLAIETSATPCCGAIEVHHMHDSLNQDFYGTKITGFAALEEPRDLSRRVVSLLDEALQAAHWTLDEVDVLAVGLGPGSWTGLRIGLSALKTLAQARDLPLLGIGTFEALRQAAPPFEWEAQFSLATVAPSRPGEIYAAMAKPGEAAPLQVRVLPTAEFAAELSTHSGELRLAGLNAATLEEVAGAIPMRFGVAAPKIVRVGGRDLLSGMAFAVAERFTAGHRDDPLRLEPIYLAPSNAERVRDEKLRAATSSSS